MLNTACAMESPSNQEIENNSIPTVPTTEAPQKIYVQNSNSGYTMLPHSILKEVMTLTGKKSDVFLYIWERTVSFRSFRQKMDVEEIMNATNASRSTVQRSTQWLQENGWLTMEDQPGKENIYGISPKLLKSHGCLVDPTPVKSDMGSLLGSKILDLRKETKEPKPKVNLVTTGNSQKDAKVEVSGTPFQIIKSEDPPMVRDMVRYGVNKHIIEMAVSKKGEQWVNNIYREFNDDVQKSHNMKNPAAVLASRLKDFHESWRKTSHTQANAGDSSAENWKDYLQPGLVEEFQELVYKQYDHPEANRGYVLKVMMDFKQRAGITLTQALEVIDVRGASRDDLHDWNHEVLQ